MKKFEIERKFLLASCSVKHFLHLHSLSYTHQKIQQFYMPEDSHGKVRYRHMGNTYIKTLKKGNGLVREEYETLVSKKEYILAVKEKKGHLIKKIRYRISVGENVFEIDQFRGRLKGLVFLEVEFPNVKAAKKFRLSKPFAAILIEEVTDKVQFSNNALSEAEYIPSLSQDTIVSLEQSRSDDRKISNTSIYPSFHTYERTDHVIKAIICSLLVGMKENAQAILSGDNDQERVHQLRAEMRKLHILLSTFRVLFNSRFYSTQKERLKQVMALTNDKRDMDVYLNKMLEYKKIVPDTLIESLSQIENYLHASEEKANSQLHALLQGNLFSQTIQGFEEIYDGNLQKVFLPAACTPVSIMANEILKVHYHKVCRSNKKISKDSPPKMYHQVRIEMKKLRYLMEFFSPLFKKNMYDKMQKRMKNILDILGDHQDLNVQAEYLRVLKEKSQFQYKKTVQVRKVLQKYLEQKAKKKRKMFRHNLESFMQSESLFIKMLCGYKNK